MSTAEVVTIGLVLVFSLLILITVVLYILPLFLNPSHKKVQKKEVVLQEASQTEETNAGIPGEIIAAIMAAIAAEEEAQGVPYGNFRVVAFRRIGRK